MIGISPAPAEMGPVGPAGPTGPTGGGGTAFGPLSWQTDGNPGVSGTLYLFPGHGMQSTTEYFELVAGPGAYTTLQLTASLGTPTDTIAFTVRKNGVDQALSATLAANGTSASGSGSVSVVAGDRISIKMVQSGTQVSSARIGVGLY
jgi:hypothetical protein